MMKADVIIPIQEHIQLYSSHFTGDLFCSLYFDSILPPFQPVLYFQPEYMSLLGDFSIEAIFSLLRFRIYYPSAYTAINF